MKRIFSLILCAVLALMLITSCAPQEEGPVTITIWHDKEPAVAEILQAELDKIPDIEVKLENKSNLTEALKIVGNDPKAAPDMYMFAHDKIGVYAEIGILAPITDFVAPETFENYIPMTVDAVTYKDEIYQLPIYFETLLYMYNRRYMDDDEVPKTTEELYAYMEKTTAGGHYGFVEQHSTAYYSAGWLHGFGAQIITQDARPALNSENAINALTYHKKFVDLMPGESEYATVNTLFNEGKAHSTIGGPWMVPTAREAGIDLGLAPMPIVDETGLAIAPYAGVQGVHVLKLAAENKKEEVTAVLNALISPEVGIALALQTGSAPANLTAYEDERIASDEVVILMRETAENAMPIPNIPEMDVMWTVATNLLVDINLSGEDVKTAADSAQKNAEELIAAMQ